MLGVLAADLEDRVHLRVEVRGRRGMRDDLVDDAVRGSVEPGDVPTRAGDPQALDREPDAVHVAQDALQAGALDAATRRTPARARRATPEGRMRQRCALTRAPDLPTVLPYERDSRPA